MFLFSVFFLKQESDGLTNDLMFGKSAPCTISRFKLSELCVKLHTHWWFLMDKVFLKGYVMLFRIFFLNPKYVLSST